MTNHCSLSNSKFDDFTERYTFTVTILMNVPNRSASRNNMHLVSTKHTLSTSILSGLWMKYKNNQRKISYLEETGHL